MFALVSMPIVFPCAGSDKGKSCISPGRVKEPLFSRWIICVQKSKSLFPKTCFFTSNLFSPYTREGGNVFQPTYTTLPKKRENRIFSNSFGAYDAADTEVSFSGSETAEDTSTDGFFTYIKNLYPVGVI